MRVLIWASPWVGQSGDIYFGLNSFSKHLLRQAKVLAASGCEVSVAYPTAYQNYVADLDPSIRLIPINSFDAIGLIGGWKDPSPILYRDGVDSELNAVIVDWLRPLLPKAVDCILLWETPDSYLRALYPDALVVGQMPGSFSRAPYPKTTIFDPVGLYKTGVLFSEAKAIAADVTPVAPWVGDFLSRSQEIFRGHQYRSKNAILSGIDARGLSILPLQISGHYAFDSETGFGTQAEFAVEALRAANANNGVLVTEYISNLYQDRVMTPDFHRFLKQINDRVIYHSELGNVPSATQHLLQMADEVIVATSGLAFQAMVWNVPVTVVGDTWLKPFDKSNVATDIERERILSFILSRHQPLTDLIVGDGNYLTALLEELKGRRKNVGLERMADLASFSADYERKVFKGFRGDEVSRNFVNLGLHKTSEGKVEKFRKLLERVKPGLISFDLFDTLITRGFEAPADLYRYMEADLRGRGVAIPFDFAEKRLSAELAARANAAGEEISLLDIYREFQKSENIPDQFMQELVDYEISVEIRVARPRPIGAELYQAALKAEVPLCITSDMYLPKECIEAIVQKIGYTEAKLYLSSDIGVTKRSGNLFEYIAKKNSIDASRIVHTGDNYKTDVLPAENKGVVTFHVPRSVEYLWEHEIFSKAFPKRKPLASLARSVMAAAVAERVFRDPKPNQDSGISGGDPWLFGYAAVGPLVLGFVNWMRASAKENGIETLHFLSREGKILKDVFDRIELEQRSGIKSNYLYGSRRAIRVAQLESFSDIVELARQTIDRTASVERILTQRFGLLGSDIDDAMLRAAGYASREDKVSQDVAGFAKLLKLLSLLSPKILALAESERSVYLRYLHENGLSASDKTAVVDVGWNANMQGSLGQLLGKPLNGYYMASLDSAARWKMVGHRIRCYYVEDCSVLTGKPLLNNRLMVENIICDISASVKNIKLVNGRYMPEFAGVASINRVQLVSAIHDGVRAFVDDVCKVLGGIIETVDFRPDVTMPIFDEFLSRPHAMDARMFAGQAIDDNFSGTDERYYLAPLNRNQEIDGRIKSYWKPGADALVAVAASKQQPDADTEKKATGNVKKKTDAAVRKNAAAEDAAIRLSSRAKIVDSLSRPLLSPHLSNNEKKRLADDPHQFYASAKHPILRLVGWAAGFR
ncbi:hypothetical protein C7405_103449 [Paraburkholderia caballeronis]|uniref:HAD family hydrolase n=1 Tax=Paraburkholderia caballeronis TaxID=416943 RepID=UPI00106713E6|nr:hypothetical protein [Paraburkholderia caballeronis]TDV37319.1 hypothetical protein C7405_103449 [Paraburkholderia caballeronis]